MNLPEIENNAKGVIGAYKEALRKGELNRDEMLLASMKGLYESLLEHCKGNGQEMLSECIYRCCYLALYGAKLELFIEELPTSEQPVEKL